MNNGKVMIIGLALMVAVAMIARAMRKLRSPVCYPCGQDMVPYNPIDPVEALGKIAGRLVGETVGNALGDVLGSAAEKGVESGVDNLGGARHRNFYRCESCGGVIPRDMDGESTAMMGCMVTCVVVGVLIYLLL